MRCDTDGRGTMATPSDGFDTAHRERIKFHVRTLVTEYGSIVRAREIARETRLLGAETSRSDPGELKRQIPDADRLSAVLISAFADPGRRRAAAQTVFRLGDEALHSKKVDPRLGEIFRRARAAMNESDGDRMTSRLSQLGELARQTDDLRLAETVGFVLVCGAGATSGQVPMHRVQAVLGPTARVQVSRGTPVAAAATPEAPIARPSGGTSEVSDAPRREELGSATEDAPRLVESDARPLVVAEQSAVPAGDAGLDAGVDPQTPPVRTWASMADFFEDDLARAREVVLRALGSREAAEQQATEHFTRVRTARGELEEAADLERTPDYLPVIIELRRRTSNLAAATEDLIAAENRCATAAQEARRVAGSVAGTEPIENIAQLDALVAAVRGVMEELRSAIGEEPAWLEWQRATPSDLGAMASEARSLLDHFATERRGRRSVLVAVPEAGPAARLESTEGVPRLEHPFLLRFLEQAREEGGPAGFLPLDARTPPQFARGVGAGADDATRVDTLAHNLLRFWCLSAMRRQFPSSRLFALVHDGGAIARHARRSADAGWFNLLLTGLALDAALDDRARSPGRARRARLLDAPDAASALGQVVEIATEASSTDAIVHAVTSLLEAELSSEMAAVIARLPAQDALAGRLLTDAIATALAGLRWGPSSARALGTFLAAFAELPRSVEDALGYVEDALQLGVKKALPALPRTVQSRQASTLILRVADLLRMTGGAEVARINVSVPGHVPALIALPGETTLEIPLLVRNAGSGSAAAIEILARSPLKPTPPVLADYYAEKQLPFLARQSMEQGSSTITSIEVEVEEIDPARHQTLNVVLQVRWLGSGSQTTMPLEIPLRHEKPAITFRPIDGALGEPVDLNDADTLELSSSVVRQAFVTFRDRLAKGDPVRAVVYGRRRRGKSSISRSLELNAGVTQKWIVVRDTLNAAPLRSLSEALARLAGALSPALRRADIGVSDPVFRSGESSAEFAGTFKNWLVECSRAAVQPVRVLLLLDEFQRWLSALDREGRLSLLGILRDFNEAVYGTITVAFVLSGLRNLETLIEASADFKNSVDRYEVPALTEGESLVYLARRIDPPLDGRTRLRLHRMSGGNPYLLNRLGLRLHERLQALGRGWATMLDVDRLFDEDAGDSRIDDYVQYMLREDEEDASPTLRQLSALRAVASVLNLRRDYEGSVAVEEVESWLRQHRVTFETGVPLEHMRQLASIGALETRGDTFSLPGEWLCRRLAAIGGDLQPVTRQTATDLILGRYRKVRSLGGGGQSVVCLAQNVQEGGHDVVLKVYRSGDGNLEDIRTRVAREAELLSRVRHDCVVKCRGSSIDERHGGVVILDHVDGQCLDEIVEEAPEYARAILVGGDPAAQTGFFASLADGLAECHRHRIVHKDLTPRNVLVVQRLGTLSPMLIDFGLAALEGEAEETPASTTHWVSPGFVAPEKLSGARRTRASDVWSLGAIMLHGLTGRSLLHGPGALAVLGEVREQLPVRLAALLFEMLDPDPRVRPPATVVRDRLNTILEPTSWEDLKEIGEHAFVEERLQDAADAMLRAMHLAGPASRTELAFHELLRSAVDLIAILPAHTEWYPTWIEDALPILLAVDATGLEPRHHASIAARFDAPATSAARARVWGTMLRTLAEQADPAGAPSALVEALCRRALEVPAEQALPLYGVFVDALQRGSLQRGALHDYCVERARVAFERETALVQTVAWLRRALYILPTPSRDHTELRKRFDAQYKLTANAPPLPTECAEDAFRGAIMGDKEGGHTDFERLDRFARKLYARHSFVCGVERVNLQRRITGIRRPTLLPITSARGLRSADQGRSDVLACVLDDGFTRGAGPLLVRILLDRDTTPKQRDTAFRALADDLDLFEVRDVGET